MENPNLFGPLFAALFVKIGCGFVSESSYCPSASLAGMPLVSVAAWERTGSSKSALAPSNDTKEERRMGRKREYSAALYMICVR